MAPMAGCTARMGTRTGRCTDGWGTFRRNETPDLASPERRRTPVVLRAPCGPRFAGCRPVTQTAASCHYAGEPLPDYCGISREQLYASRNKSVPSPTTVSALCAAILIATGAAFAEPIALSRIHVLDGDTIRIDGHKPDVMRHAPIRASINMTTYPRIARHDWCACKA